MHILQVQYHLTGLRFKIEYGIPELFAYRLPLQWLHIEVVGFCGHDEENYHCHIISVDLWWEGGRRGRRKQSWAGQQLVTWTGIHFEVYTVCAYSRVLLNGLNIRTSPVACNWVWTMTQGKYQLPCWRTRSVQQWRRIGFSPGWSPDDCQEVIVVRNPYKSFPVHPKSGNERNWA